MAAGNIKTLLPAFSMKHPEGWFKKCDAAFYIAGLDNRSDLKYYHVIVALPLKLVHDLGYITRVRPDVKPYERLKKAVIRHLKDKRIVKREVVEYIILSDDEETVNLECPICFNVIPEDRILDCGAGHASCDTCLKSMKQQGMKTCPSCLRPLTEYAHHSTAQRTAKSFYERYAPIATPTRFPASSQRKAR